MQGGWAAKNASTFARTRRLRDTTRPDASAPCAWKTRFAISNPIVLACPTDASSSGRSTPPPWHADAVRGRPSHHGDRRRGQFCGRAQRLDGGVVPSLDFAKKDLGQRRPVEHEFAPRGTAEVYDRHDATHDHGELHETVLVEVVAFQRRVGCAKGDSLSDDLLDAAAGPDRLRARA